MKDWKDWKIAKANMAVFCTTCARLYRCRRTLLPLLVPHRNRRFLFPSSALKRFCGAGIPMEVLPDVAIFLPVSHRITLGTPTVPGKSYGAASIFKGILKGCHFLDKQRPLRLVWAGQVLAAATMIGARVLVLPEPLAASTRVSTAFWGCEAQTTINNINPLNWHCCRCCECHGTWVSVVSFSKTWPLFCPFELYTYSCRSNNQCLQFESWRLCKNLP